VHIKGRNEPRARDINLYSSDDAVHCPALAALNLPAPVPCNPNTYGRPNPDWVNITQYETSAKSQYDGFQFGASKRLDRRFQFQASYTLSWTKNDHEGNRFAGVNNPFNLANEWAAAASDQRHRFVTNWIVMLPYDVRASTILFVGSPRVTSATSSYDPFSTGSGNGRWAYSSATAIFNAPLESQTVPRNALLFPRKDIKLDFSLSKTFKIRGRYAVTGIASVYNLTNRSNIGSIGTNIAATSYKNPLWSTGDTYQPRQVQLAFRIQF
jgi:hypothetical protein